MRLLITEVTEMHAGAYCVAGWCADAARMVRPLPGGRHWTAPLLSEHGVAPGATIVVRPRATQPHGDYPHQTEDLLIHRAGIVLTGCPGLGGVRRTGVTG